MSVNQRAPNGVAGDTLSKPINSTGDVVGVLELYAGMSFIYSLSDEVSNSIIEALQDFFMAYPLGKAFNDSLAPVNKSVIIKDSFSADAQQLPQIVIQSTPAEHIPLHLGNKQGMETFNDRVFETYGGNVNIATSLNIYDSGKPNVARLADVVFLAFMYYVPMVLRRRYMFVQPQVKFTNPTKQTGTALGGDVFMNTLSVPVITDWHQYFELATPEQDTIRTEMTQTIS